MKEYLLQLAHNDRNLNILILKSLHFVFLGRTYLELREEEAAQDHL